MRLLVALLLTVLLASSGGHARGQAPPPAQPELPPQYEVEIIVFEHLGFDPTEERFEQKLDGFADDPFGALREAPVFDETTLPLAVPPIEPLPPLDPLAAERAEALSIRLLPPEALKLGNEYRRLAASARYRPLVHAGWVQPGLPEADAEAFDLKTLGVLNPRGTVRLHLINFLHVTLDLTFEGDAAAAPAPGPSNELAELELAPRYHLTASRRVSRDELHYFDHPAFGVLVRVTTRPAANADARSPAA